MWYISNKYWFLNKSAKKHFCTSDLTPLLHFKNIWGLHCRSFQKHPLFRTLLQIFTADEERNTSNKYWTHNELAKYQSFYTRETLSILQFKKKLVHSIAKMFWNIHFLPYFYYFQQYEVGSISNTFWLSNKSAKKTFA